MVLFSIHFPLYLVYDNLKRTEALKQTGLGGRMGELVKAEGSSYVEYRARYVKTFFF